MQRFATAIIMNSSLLLFPLLVTAFGDIITWEKNEFVGIVKYNLQNCDIIIKSLKYFLQYLDNSYVTDNFELDLYRQAVLKHGPLSYNQCFGFVPLLALGGFKDVEHMDKVKVLEHIYLMYQLTGGVMDD